jgi:hypothetical protein
MKTLLSILAFCTFLGCTLPTDPEIPVDPSATVGNSITVDYAGEFYVFMINEDEGSSQSYLYGGKENKVWTEEDLKPIIGKLTNLEVRGIKVLGTAYPDYGNLAVTIDDGSNVLIEGIAPEGTQRVVVNYSF